MGTGTISPDLAAASLRNMRRGLTLTDSDGVAARSIAQIQKALFGSNDQLLTAKRGEYRRAQCRRIRIRAARGY
jgi:hypothetical protein